MGFTTLLADEKQAITNHYNQNLSLYEPNFIMKRTWECKFQKNKKRKIFSRNVRGYHRNFEHVCEAFTPNNPLSWIGSRNELRHSKSTTVAA